jgi:hypothetical protein
MRSFKTRRQVNRLVIIQMKTMIFGVAVTKGFKGETF